MESIAQILASRLPESEKRRHKIEITEQFLKDKAEMELLAIRTDLAATKNPEAIKAEMYWADEDMKSDRCPDFLREQFRNHKRKCEKLLV